MVTKRVIWGHPGTKTKRSQIAFAVTSIATSINKATRTEGEAIMSAPPLFESAGRGDLEFWGAVEGPTVIIWKSLSEFEKTNWLEKK